MNGSRSSLLRALRWLSFLICASGVAFAVEHSRSDSIRPGKSFLDWISLIPLNETASVDLEPVTAPITPSRGSVSTGEFLHHVLFSRPANGWRLDPFTGEIEATRSTQLETPMVTQRSAGLSTWAMSGPVFSPRASAVEMIAAPDGGPPPGPAFWVANASGNWSNPANWKDGLIASGSGAIAHFDTLDITTDVTVTLDSSRLIGEVYIGDTNGTHRYDITPGSGGERLIFDSVSGSSVGTSILQQISTSAGDTISVPIALDSDLIISNLSTAHPFQISGNISSNRAPPTVLTLTFQGNVNVSGDITLGSSGGDLNLTISGNVSLSGTNTYTGLTFVTGTLFVKGDNSGADGFVQVSGNGSVLSGIGTIGGIVTIQGGTITAGSETTVGHLTLLQSLTIQATQGGGGTLLANLDGDISDLLSITGTFNIGSGNTLDIQGAADGTTTYTLATYLSHTGMFDTIIGLPDGYDLFYLPNELVLAPVPEPATWAGGALALGSLGFVRLRKLRRSAGA